MGRRSQEDDDCVVLEEVAERMEEWDIVEEMLVQLGLFVSGRAYNYGVGSDKGREGGGARELEE